MLFFSRCSGVPTVFYTFWWTVRRAAAPVIDNVSLFFCIILIYRIVTTTKQTLHVIWLMEKCSQQSRIFNYAFSIQEFKKLPLEVLIGIAIWKLVCPDLIAVIAFLLSKLYIKLGNQHFRKRQYWLLQLTCACQELFGLTLFHSSIQIEFKLKVPIFL